MVKPENSEIGHLLCSFAIGNNTGTEILQHYPKYIDKELKCYRYGWKEDYHLSKYLKTILDYMTQLFFRPQYVSFFRIKFGIIPKYTCMCFWYDPKL